MKAQPSQSELLVMALYRLEQRCKCYVTVSGLTIEAWRADPLEWGLPGYEREYPSHNKCVCCLCGKRGPVRRGWIDRPIPGLAVVRLTDKGRRAVREIERRAALMEGAA